MTTERKRWANQQNAKQSTGPKTLAGKARSKRNAWKHGLSTPVSVQPHFVDLLQDLETCLEGESEHALIVKDAQVIAVAILEVLRARSVRTLMLDQLFKHCADQAVAGASTSKQTIADIMQHVLRADYYERRALSRRNRAIRLFHKVVKGVG
jgi:hypothetical protein